MIRFSFSLRCKMLCIKTVFEFCKYCSIFSFFKNILSLMFVEICNYYVYWNMKDDEISLQIPILALVSNFSNSTSSQPLKIRRTTQLGCIALWVGQFVSSPHSSLRRRYAFCWRMVYHSNSISYYFNQEILQNANDERKFTYTKSEIISFHCKFI